MRSTSGTGIDRPVPNIKPPDTCLGIWSTVLAEYTFFVRAAWSNTRPYTSPERLCALGLPT